MPTEIQRPELVDRLRRSLGIVGRLPLVLDEVVVPIVLTNDLDKQPYRLSAVAFLNIDAATGDATHPGQIAITLPLTPGIERERTLGAVVVKQLRFENGAAAAIYSLRISFNLTGGAGWSSPAGNCFNVDRFHDAGGTQVRTPIAMRRATTIAAVGTQVDTTTMQANTRYDYYFARGESGLVLGPGSELVISGPNAVGIQVTAYGDFYPDVLL